jgi:hypothetical protein
VPTQVTIDPANIQSPSQIPPPGSRFLGRSSQGLADVYCGTLPGDVDAQPAAKELLGTALDTGGLSNADYIYTQVAALYGGSDLPSFHSPSGNSIKSVVFVSGSSQGSYGAFHLEGSQVDFDRIVTDSLNASGNYSAGSGLGAALAPVGAKAPRLFPIHRGTYGLLGILHAGDARLEAATPAAIREALTIATQSTLALRIAVETRNAAVVPRRNSSPRIDELAKGGHLDLVRRLIHENQSILGLVDAAAGASAGRQYLSTALFAAEIVESFQLLTRKASAGQTDGEAVSRVVAFKLAPEIALIPGFNGGVTQQWWRDHHPDFVNDNSQNDQSVDGNAAGVMFLEFLTDYLGIPMDRILRRMPSTGGAPLGETYVALLSDYPGLIQAAGQDGKSAFQKMISLLEQNTQNADGSLNLPADGNPFPSMPGAKQGGLFEGKAPISGSLAQDAQAALGLEAQVEQQVASLKAALQRLQGDSSGNTAAGPAIAPIDREALAFAYKPPLVASVVAGLEQRAASFRAPQFDESLQNEFWKHVYNELPGSGINTDRLQVITGTNQAPEAVQVSGTISSTKPEADGDLHISFQPDDPNFPTNQDSSKTPLEIEVIYAGPVTQHDAQPAAVGFTNPFSISQLGPGTRIQAAGPFIFDRAHGIPASDGKNVQFGLEIHPVVGMTVLSGDVTPPVGPPIVTPPVGPPVPPAPPSQLSQDLASAMGQAEALRQTLGNLSSLLQKMKGEIPPG